MKQELWLLWSRRWDTTLDVLSFSPSPMNLGGGQCQVGSLTGAVASTRVHIDGEVWHLDVGSSHPGAWRRSQGFGCSPIKVVRELGLERRETVRSLSAVGVGYLRGFVLSTRGPG